MTGEDFRAAARARARALAAELDAARRRAGVLWPTTVAAYAERLREALRRLIALEVAPGRLLPWLAVGFGLGVVIYFDADREPALLAAIAAAVAGVAVAIAARKTALGFALASAFASVACGFAVITWKTASIAHPVLHFSATVDLKGFIEVREEREKTDRIVVRIHQIEGRRLNEVPDRVRLAVRKGSAPAVGEFITLKARLSPPLAQLRPGGYDFARDMYFQRIGASGYALGPVKVEPPPIAISYWLRYLAFVDGIREAIDDRIRAALPGDQGSIASALITGKRDAISAPVNDAMYVSSLAHVLSISGYHMVVVAGIVFFVLRASLALFSPLATRRPIKKWAAVAALMAATFYLLLSGAEVATQRSYIMIAIVLLGVMFDRPALTLRTLSLAAFGVLLLAPQAVIHPSFQMSFAATLALVAAYQNGLSWRADRDSSLAARAALWGAREVVGLILASLVAGLATTPFVAFHFHRLAPYGVLANLLAMPIVSAWVMPMGILGVIAAPFGFDAPLWHAMGWGIDWMISVAHWVASLPGAVGRIAAFGTGPLLLATAGLLLVCLLRTKLRWSGVLFAGLATLWIATTKQPDVYVAGDGQSAAFRSENGKLSILHRGRDSFAIREWLAADADSRPIDDKTLNKHVRCDDIGCVGRLGAGRLIAMPLIPEAFGEDCVRATLVVSAREAPGDCHAMLIDRRSLREYGAASVRFKDDGAKLRQARPHGYERPWSQPPRRSPQAPASRDATPASNNLEADD